MVFYSIYEDCILLGYRMNHGMRTRWDSCSLVPSTDGVWDDKDAKSQAEWDTVRPSGVSYQNYIFAAANYDRSIRSKRAASLLSFKHVLT
jgi:hypothetical protein